MARVWYRAVSALLIRRRRPIGEPGEGGRNGGGRRHSPALDVIDGTAGAGRICAALLELGIGLSGVRQAVVDADASIYDLDAIDLEARFDLAALGSHLINLPDDDRRSAFVRLVARHVGGGGRVLVEHHPIDWAETAEPTTPTPGADVGMDEVRRHPPYVSAVSTFDIGGRYVRQPFTARVLSDAELADALGTSGLVVTRRLGPTWLEAVGSTIEARAPVPRASRSCSG
jgi:hypothetical protein